MSWPYGRQPATWTCAFRCVADARPLSTCPSSHRISAAAVIALRLHSPSSSSPINGTSVTRLCHPFCTLSEFNLTNSWISHITVYLSHITFICAMSAENLAQWNAMQKASLDKNLTLSDDIALQILSRVSEITARLGSLPIRLKGRAGIIMGRTLQFAANPDDALAFLQTLATISQDPVLFQKHLDTLPL